MKALLRYWESPRQAGSTFRTWFSQLYSVSPCGLDWTHACVYLACETLKQGNKNFEPTFGRFHIKKNQISRFLENLGDLDTLAHVPAALSGWGRVLGVPCRWGRALRATRDTLTSCCTRQPPPPTWPCGSALHGARRADFPLGQLGHLPLCRGGVRGLPAPCTSASVSGGLLELPELSGALLRVTTAALMASGPKSH